MTRNSGADSAGAIADNGSLKYSLLGPSLTKAGQDAVDQSKVAEIIYEASKGSKFFKREQEKDRILTQKIEQILAKKRSLEKRDLSSHLRAADNLLAQLEQSRDLTQHILHVDCDAFYAAVEQLDRPELRELPFAVGVGVLTTCNYVARKYGCRSGMAGFVAKKLCPSLILLPLNFEKYSAKAREVRAVLAKYDANFESASIDEAYLNITQYCTEHGMEAAQVASKLRKEIEDKALITVSAGIGANTRLAKICSNMRKPNDQFLLPSDRTAIIDFMRKLPCRKVNGIGRVLERELQSIGITTCGDIFAERQYLNCLFGEKTYDFLLRCHLGLGRTKVQAAEDYERKSVGTETTFHETGDGGRLQEKLKQVAQELERDLKRVGVRGRTLCLKVKLASYEVLTRQRQVSAIHSAHDLYTQALPMLVRLEEEIPGMKLRLMGLRCTQLVSTKRPDPVTFFGLEAHRESKSERREASIMEEGWETWAAEGMLGVNSSRGFHVPDVQAGRQSTVSYRRGGKVFLPGSRQDQEGDQEGGQEGDQEDEGNEARWSCPICNRLKPAEEINGHIDTCLSRQAIREAIHQEAAGQKSSSQKASSESPAPESKKPKDRKRGRGSLAPDPKQKKLCFG